MKTTDSRNKREDMPLGEKLLCVRHGVSFVQALNEAISTPELVSSFDRLYGASLSSSSSRSPIERMVDKATGKQEDDMRAFIDFVWKYIFLRFEPL